MDVLHAVPVGTGVLRFILAPGGHAGPGAWARGPVRPNAGSGSPALPHPATPSERRAVDGGGTERPLGWQLARPVSTTCYYLLKLSMLHSIWCLVDISDYESSYCICMTPNRTRQRREKRTSHGRTRRTLHTPARAAVSGAVKTP
eukprot:962288-Prymnesium_polylepis.1